MITDCEICDGSIRNYIDIRHKLIAHWYFICSDCINRYPEISLKFSEISNLKDGEYKPNHNIMFDLIEEIKIRHNQISKDQNRE